MEIQITNSNTHVCAYVTARGSVSAGYGSSVKRLRKFYRNCGFIMAKRAEYPGLMSWKPKE
ncbi:MAG: hypothetical protein L0177_16065 [Chloroflexi bacterium]|nr:hypothetical protein [Chloroflexota bacterium]